MASKFVGEFVQPKATVAFPYCTLRQRITTLEQRRSRRFIQKHYLEIGIPS